MVNACRKILREMGPIGFYAGVVPYVTMDGLSGAIKVGQPQPAVSWAGEEGRGGEA